MKSLPESRTAGTAVPDVSVRAGFVITGTEVLTGIIRDRNGPWLSDRLADLGVELAHIVITGDRPDDLTAALGVPARRGRAI